jgi:hypothetical protein
MGIAVGTYQPDHLADVGVEGGHAIGDLRAGNDHKGARIVVEAAIADVADDADDLPGGLSELGRTENARKTGHTENGTDGVTPVASVRGYSALSHQCPSMSINVHQCQKV